MASSIPSLTLTPVVVNEAKYSMYPKLYKMLVSKDRQDDVFFNIFLLAQQMNSNERFAHKKKKKRLLPKKIFCCPKQMDSLSLTGFLDTQY